MAFDENYQLPGLTVILSVLRNLDPGYNCHFSIMTEQGKEPGKNTLEVLKLLNHNFDYRYCHFDPEQFTRLPGGLDYVNHYIFARLLIDSFADELEGCFYIDSDVLVTGDLSQLYRYCTDHAELQQSYLAAADDLSIQYGTDPFFADHRHSIGFSAEDTKGYFSAGVMFLNLRKIREDHIREKCLDIAARGYLFADQDILNIVCKNHVLHLPVRYNFASVWANDMVLALQPDLSTENRDTLLRKDPVIWHFSGPDKPWKTLETEAEALWYSYASQVPCEDPVIREQLAALKETDLTQTWTDCREIVRNYESVVLYGYTYISRKTVDNLLAQQYGNIRCFCDRDPQKNGRQYRGIPCCLPDRALSEYTSDHTAFVICAQTAWPEISKELTGAGISPGHIYRFRLRDWMILRADQR